MRSHLWLSIADSQIQACLHFQQALSIEGWLSWSLWVRIKAPTGLGYTVTGSINRGLNSTFNDDIQGKTSDLLIHKESYFHSEERANWIRFIEIERVKWYQFLIKCVLRLFIRDEIPFMTVHCRFTNTGLFVLSTNIVHWSMTPIMSLCQDQSSTGLGYTVTSYIYKGSN